MKILGFSALDSGCGYHRIVLPLAFMQNIEGHVTNVPVQNTLDKGWDIVYYNRISPFDTDWKANKEKLKAKIIIDMDDDWVLPPNHIANAIYQGMKERIENNIREADMVTCTNERLYKKLAKLNPNVYIYPNALPYGLDQFTDEKIESEFVRVFWCGSITHEHDINILKNPLRRLQNNKVQMIIGGYNESNDTSRIIWDKMASVFTNNGKLNYKVLGGLSPMHYMNLYNEADICLIPLENSSWHSAKSNLKVLEAAAKKIPVIVSHVEPYSLDQDAPILWVKNQTDWLKHINYLVNNKSAREDYGEKLYEWAKEKYNLTEINQRRRQAFSDLIGA